METKLRVIMKHINGEPLNLKYEPVKTLSGAARFHDLEHYQQWITSYYKPADASLYVPKLLRITYEELEEDVQ